MKKPQKKTKTQAPSLISADCKAELAPHTAAFTRLVQGIMKKGGLNPDKIRVVINIEIQP